MSATAPSRLEPRAAAGLPPWPSPWASGDYAVIGATLVIVAEQLVEAADVRSGEKVLDVGAGTGNASLAAARRYADVTSTDLVAALLDRGRERAAVEGLPMRFGVADAQALPFADSSFDVLLSSFGAMYAADADRAAGELVRVVRPGGRIALASWTPGGLVGRLWRLVDDHRPPRRDPAAPGPAATRWGSPAHLARLFGQPLGALRCRRRSFALRYRSAAHCVQVFRDFHGPLHRAFTALDAPRQQALERAATALLERANAAGRGTLVVPADYLEAVIVRPPLSSTRPTA
jgi:SAM-dependent methyltransferase